MYFNTALMSGAHRLVSKCHRRKKGHYTEIMSEHQPLLLVQTSDKCNGVSKKIFEVEVTLKDCEDLEESTKIWEWPSEHTAKGKIWWLMTWPISFVLYMTTPDCRKYPRLYVVTFIMCIFWIGTTSYMISWFITAVGIDFVYRIWLLNFIEYFVHLGDTLNIPDSVMGLTFLAAGMSVPEAVSSIIVTNLGGKN